MPKYRGLTHEDLHDLYDDEVDAQNQEISFQNANGGLDLTKLDLATPESPVFIEGRLDDGWGDHMQPSWKGLFAVIGPRESEDYGEEARYSLYALRVDDVPDAENSSHSLQVGDFLVKGEGELENMIIVSGPEVDRLYQECQELHNNAPYIAMGTLYADQPVGKYQEYRAIPGTEKQWDLAEERLRDGSLIRSLEDGEKWILENHPAYYVGCGIQQDCPSGNVKFPAVPRAYGKGNFETVADRWAYAARAADRLGVVMGTKTWNDELTECLGINKDWIVERAQHPESATVVEVEKPFRRLPDISNITGNDLEQDGLDY